ncbi:hypothetical protein BU24DRAFT_414527 [Aaosphaeria arxii CBS 175.79]|uniref:Uncharacterized protein n=1 Tax=Aaosphaeria arxii CBS 175.79 TaxID=1450172 RepID=A0A6A5XAZ9_9PLEO|nr:uncharacterized protein BU24DRAFT_414527 [Aaosphaeria arxii CBS 175.79]KAF2010089.1 hypothetical protein BU24DRAFT_414527 [Aaosphaeria arxii CBS 175.79]
MAFPISNNPESTTIKIWVDEEEEEWDYNEMLDDYTTWEESKDAITTPIPQSPPASSSPTPSEGPSTTQAPSSSTEGTSMTHVSRSPLKEIPTTEEKTSFLSSDTALPQYSEASESPSDDSHLQFNYYAYYEVNPSTVYVDHRLDVINGSLTQKRVDENYTLRWTHDRNLHVAQKPAWERYSVVMPSRLAKECRFDDKDESSDANEEGSWENSSSESVGTGSPMDWESHAYSGGFAGFYCR